MAAGRLLQAIGHELGMTITWNEPLLGKVPKRSILSTRKVTVCTPEPTGCAAVVEHVAV
jgi:hypothetical protein